jgi:hypothetical protein
VVELEQRWLRQARRATFEDYRRQGVSAWIAPHGASMRPLIGHNTWLLVEFGAAAVRIGDIVVFPLGDMLAAHRVVARRRRQGIECLVVKGDAEPYYDPPLAPADVLGVVRALRTGARGSASEAGCAAWLAGSIATISCLSGRIAWLARRAAACLPDPPRRIALRAIPPFARVTAHTLFTPLLWAVLFRSKYIERFGRR